MSLLGPVSGWIGFFFFFVFGLLSLPTSTAVGLFMVSGGLAVWSYFAHRSGQSNLGRVVNAGRIWRHLGGTHAFGVPHSMETADLGNRINQLYNNDPDGRALPLPRAVQLLTIYHHQQQKLQGVRTDIAALRKLLTNMKRLEKLAEGYRARQDELQDITANERSLQRAQKQIEASCARLENMVGRVEREVQARQLHHEINQISARLPRSTQFVEPAFEAQSLEEIERQIGREIETYLQLERETEEHLR